MTKSNLIELEMTVVIPTAQYANVQPVVKGYGQTWEEARDDALKKAQSIWSMVGENGKSLEVNWGNNVEASNVKRDELQCFLSGSKVYFDPIAHNYVDAEGNKYISGSKFAAQFEHEFNADAIAPRCEGKLGVDTETIKEYWSSRADISTTFGTALHKALEHYGKYKDVIERDVDSKTKEPKGTGIHPSIEDAVLSFFEGRENEVAVYEPTVIDAKNFRCGQIDRLLIVDEKKKICRIQDYKTNADLEKLNRPATLKAPYTFLPNNGIGRYTLQQSFYKAIIEANGWTVEGIDIEHWNGKVWNTIELTPVELDVKPSKIDVDKILN